MFNKRTQTLRNRMRDAGIDVALITDDDSVYYYTGYYDYLHMEFGRPTILVISRHGDSLLITPSIDYNTALDNAVVDRIEPWNDGMGYEWREHIPASFKKQNQVAIEPHTMPALVREYIGSLLPRQRLSDITPVIADMRMIKSSEELQLARHAGQVANVMMEAGREAIADGVAEYEVALATGAAGTKKSSELLRTHYPDSKMSPNTHFLQIMASGEEITRTHHRASNRIMKFGEPVFLCFCGMTNFHRFKLGFDRTFWIGEIGDKSHEAVYQLAVDSQAAALAMLKPGVPAEAVHNAYAEVIQSAGYDYPFRCGRGTGFSFLEKPQLVFGDKTILQPNMVFAVDGSVSTDGFRAQVGDSFVVTENGHEALTSHPKSLEQIIIH
ncbi:MAG: aminopeptidase P family protein [Gammaproteobacteria bacterium]|nr:MAG: aminopeptidase P family protein [Gammaproteobacteria bacterium]RLA29105.1 MAG: aminopeptidase P family protein [Gammaproteobacteria bacterium]